MMIALLYVMIILLGIFLVFGFFKSDPKETGNPNANMEKAPEEMKTPVYRPFKDGPFQMTMGLRSLNVNEWIQIDRNYRQQMQLKESLLNSNNRGDLFLHKDEAFDASMETLQMLIEYLPYQYPNMFEGNYSKTKINNLITGQKFDIADCDRSHPLELAALLVQEDLVIMQRSKDADEYHANALAVCFPSGWFPRSKFGLSLASIHLAHVPFFQEKLRLSMDRYFLKLQEDKPIERLNWILQVGDGLCRTGMARHDKEVVTEDNVGRLLYLRVERQTLRRLPKSKAILFTIKTYMTKIEDVCQSDSETARRLAGAIRNWPPEISRYKGADAFKDALLAYLDRISSL